ncbi:hypothetical protein GCM10010266_03660 [Streptomyces griseomycini]|nr:hypothetical protein GCM10010266_03660 [Streptomyces griseomycini]
MTAAGSRPVPRPGPPRPAQQWFQERPSPFPWEQDALDHVRRLMPSDEPAAGGVHDRPRVRARGCATGAGRIEDRFA